MDEGIIISFRAGMCDVDDSSQPFKVKPKPEEGYIFLYKSDDELTHFCWRGRNKSPTDAELDLVMIPEDGRFVPYLDERPSAKTSGRIFVLKFASSSQRYLFWLQAKSQARDGDASWLSPRDRKLGDIVDRLLQGEEVDVDAELATVSHTDNRNNDNNNDGDGDAAMEDVEAPGGGTGGAGADATGGDVRQEGESSREGGADGARA